MRWIAKAVLQNGMAHVPRGRDINSFLQHKLTRTLPGDDDHFRLKARKTFWHFAALQRHHAGPVSGTRLFEFGAGWDLIGPLTFYGLGIEHQILVDVAPLLSLDLVGNAIRQYTALRAELEVTGDHQLRPLGPPSVRSLEELQERFGIRYLAPCDAGATALPAESVDFVSSTGTLQHIPEDQLMPILAECHRLLVPGGPVSCHIDMFDGFAQIDSSISAYNFLKFSNRTWAMVNSPFYFHNRLRAPDFVARFEAAAFEIGEIELHGPSETDREVLRTLRLAPRFRRYALEDLGVRQMSLVALSR